MLTCCLGVKEMAILQQGEQLLGSVGGDHGIKERCEACGVVLHWAIEPAVGTAHIRHLPGTLDICKTRIDK